ncbi:hypothetical protein CONCODRAFT_12566 [Conidiobolus coronatus NRRL 28638]|uniref:Uncharacterized protein n=1 Tax=Conidiobolus coronatus (strain ATCC 28846 / CBS 209.66 / NRRL 28638) TaxID=796925 RepID=A0A137NSK6_CONC2|nr:hypothetical protein CONCODRAFT_12566 [Conidiobolus coronatus NRRL 28638]|eukprot:KXN65747.1 hypothetical protein CONCODRAFT_12566 [Conidiobolus coronatus NRRL 28638]
MEGELDRGGRDSKICTPRSTTTIIPLKKDRNNLVVLFNVFNRSQRKALNESFYLNEGSTYSDWENHWLSHWLSGIRNLNDQPYDVTQLVQFELRVYTINPRPIRSIDRNRFFSPS